MLAVLLRGEELLLPIWAHNLTGGCGKRGPRLARVREAGGPVLDPRPHIASQFLNWNLFSKKFEHRLVSSYA